MECILASIFQRFLWILGTKLGIQIGLKLIQKDTKQQFGAKNPPRAAQEPTLWAQDRFFLDFDSVLGPILIPEPTKISPRLPQDS